MNELPIPAVMLLFLVGTGITLALTERKGEALLFGPLLSSLVLFFLWIPMATVFWNVTANAPISGWIPALFCMVGFVLYARKTAYLANVKPIAIPVSTREDLPGHPMMRKGPK